MDLPDQPDVPDRAERARDASAARAQMREMPDPDERGWTYEAARAHVSADTTEHGSYWAEGTAALSSIGLTAAGLFAGGVSKG